MLLPSKPLLSEEGSLSPEIWRTAQEDGQLRAHRPRGGLGELGEVKSSLVLLFW